MARRWLRDLGIAFLVSLFTLVFLFQPFKVEGTSMVPALKDQERILVNKFIYDLRNIQRGDLIVFRYPKDPNKTFIKRVIGIPGDTLEVRGRSVQLNGRQMKESYTFQEASVKQEASGRASFPRPFRPMLVPPGFYFVLGDHRSVSNDSRHWGLVAKESIYGKAVLRYWPPTHFGPLD